MLKRIAKLRSEFLTEEKFDYSSFILMNNSMNKRNIHGTAHSIKVVISFS